MYIPTDTDCSELIPGICGGKMEPTMLDNCDSMHFEGVENVDINQGVGIDLDDGVTAYDSTGMEIPFEYEPTEIDKCSVGEHEVIYKAIGADERLLPSICGDNFLSMACSGIGTLIAKRLVTIEQADPPTINGIGAATLSVDEPFDPMNGVTGVDDNGNPVDVTYSGKLADSAEGDIASFETDLTDPLRSLKVNLSPIQDGTPWIGTDHDTTPYLHRAMPTQSNDYNRESGVIVGGTVAWNQLVQNGDFADNTGWGTRYATISIADGIATFTPSSEGTVRGIVQGDMGEYAKANHKYLGLATVKPPKQVQMNLSLVGSGGGRTIIPANVWTTFGQVFTYSNPAFKERLAVYCDTNLTTSDTVQVRNAQLIDLTAMFGPTIADYIYSLEQATAGAGVAWLRANAPQLFEYHAYDAGSLVSVSGLTSHDMVGFNQFDKSTSTAGKRFGSSGMVLVDRATGSVSDYIKALPNTVYYAKNVSGSAQGNTIVFYDADKSWIGTVDIGTYTSESGTFTTPNNCAYIRFQYETANENTVCINISDPSLNGTYKSHVKHSYPLDSTLTLRGIPKLDASNNLYYDGDIYESDGVVTRKYGIVDLGTLDWEYDSGLVRFFTTAPNNTPEGIPMGLEDVICGKYWNAYGKQTAFNNNEIDKCFLFKSTFIGGGRIYVRDTAYTSVADFKTAVTGTIMVYPLATPTTETAQAYTNPQIVDPDGTEEYVTANSVPVGHDSTYSLVCPISGYDEVNVVISPTTSASDGQTYTADLPQTVYGGTVDLVTGEVVIDRAMVTLDGSEPWSWDSYYLQGSIQKNDMKRLLDYRGSMLCDSLVTRDEGYSYQYPLSVTGYASSSLHEGENWLYVRNASLNSRAEFIAWISELKPTVVYELATPIPFNIDPQTIPALFGRNNVWSEQGDVYVEFWKSIPQGEFSYPLDGVYAIDYHAEDECGNVNDSTRAIIVGDVGMRTVLYEDGTLIINESINDIANNVRLHGALIREYASLDTDHPYVFSNEEQRPWNNDIALIRAVEIGTQIQPTDISYWFKGFENCEQFTLDNMDTSATTEMYEVFRGCTSVTELDLSMFDTNAVRHTNFMFRDCTSLVTIFATDDFDLSNAWDTTLMFSECISLVGGSGTVFDPYYTNKEYARIDNPPTAPGYFTAKE